MPVYLQHFLDPGSAADQIEHRHRVGEDHERRDRDRQEEVTEGNQASAQQDSEHERSQVGHERRHGHDEERVCQR